MDEFISEIEEIENGKEYFELIFPPKDFGVREIRFQSSIFNPEDILILVNLERELMLELKAADAKEIGICPTRERLFVKCFNELIRQEEIFNPQRGLLLKWLKYELYNQINKLQKLYKSSVTYGLRKNWKVENEKNQLINKKTFLLKEKLNKTRQIENIFKEISKEKKCHESVVNKSKIESQEIRYEIQNRLKTMEKQVDHILINHNFL